jgi:xylulose-5-phosphate/fructose-6-phosphate phosphoketolase
LLDDDGKLVDHTTDVREHGEEMPEMRDWQWPS